MVHVLSFITVTPSFHSSFTILFRVYIIQPFCLGFLMYRIFHLIKFLNPSFKTFFTQFCFSAFSLTFIIHILFSLLVLTLKSYSTEWKLVLFFLNYRNVLSLAFSLLMSSHKSQILYQFYFLNFILYSSICIFFHVSLDIFPLSTFNIFHRINSVIYFNVTSSKNVLILFSHLIKCNEHTIKYCSSSFNFECNLHFDFFFCKMFLNYIFISYPFAVKNCFHFKKKPLLF